MRLIVVAMLFTSNAPDTLTSGAFDALAAILTDIYGKAVQIKTAPPAKNHFPVFISVCQADLSARAAMLDMRIGRIVFGQ